MLRVHLYFLFIFDENIAMDPGHNKAKVIVITLSKTNPNKYKNKITILTELGSAHPQLVLNIHACY